MTQHNKWKLFQIDLSFLGWKILSLPTLGILIFSLLTLMWPAAERKSIFPFGEITSFPGAPDMNI